MMVENTSNDSLPNLCQTPSVFLNLTISEWVNPLAGHV
jgi:hypothetical protein